MSIVRLVLREIAHRPGSFLLGTLWIALAVAACITLASLYDAASRETRRIQRDIGFNLRIIPAQDDVDNFLLTGQPTGTMPQDVASRLARQESVSYNHLVATLHGQVKVDGKPVLVTGIAETLFPEGHKKPPMVPTIEPGTAHVGRQIAQRLGLAKGDSLSLEGFVFEVSRVAPATGGQEDLRVWLALADAQQVLGKPEQINEVQAIDCLCVEPSEAPQEHIAEEVERVAPEAQVVMLQKIATARARQRRMSENLARVGSPVAVIAGMAGLVVLSWLNVRQRLSEIALLKVLGKSPAFVASLVLGKALLWGLLGAIVGAAVGIWLGEWWAAQLFPSTGAKFSTDYELVWWIVLGAPVVACFAASLAAVLAATQDPALVLREE